MDTTYSTQRQPQQTGAAWASRRPPLPDSGGQSLPSGSPGTLWNGIEMSKREGGIEVPVLPHSLAVTTGLAVLECDPLQLADIATQAILEGCSWESRFQE